MNTKLTIGIILMIIGIAAIVVSQTANFTYRTSSTMNLGFLGNVSIPDYETNYELKNGLLYGGIGFLLIGGILLAISLGRNKSLIKENITDIEGENKILFCPNCGTKLEGNNKFCPECGDEIC